MSVVGILLLLLPGFILVSSHHHPPTLCNLVTRSELEGSDNLVEEPEEPRELASRSCGSFLACTAGPLAAILPDNTPVNYNYCKRPSSTVPMDKLNNYMLHKILGYTCNMTNPAGRKGYQDSCPIGSLCSRGPYQFLFPDEGYYTMYFCAIANPITDLNDLDLY